MMNRSRWIAVILLLAAFGLGALAGGVGVSAAEHGRLGSPRHAHGRSGYVERLTETLSLSPTQRDSIRQILDRHSPAMDSLWQEVRPRFDSMRLTVRNAIRAQLTPDQLQAYNTMLERRDREYQERRKHGRR